MISEQRRTASAKMGNIAEQKFVISCQNIGYKCIKTDKKTDIENHIDFYIVRKNGTNISVDVKGGNKKDEIWVEFINVNGNKGWVVGDAQLIAFDMPERLGFYIVKREALFDYCKQEVQKIYCSKADAYKKIYQRNGRKDAITKLYLSDLLNIGAYFMPYVNYNQGVSLDAIRVSIIDILYI